MFAHAVRNGWGGVTENVDTVVYCWWCKPTMSTHGTWSRHLRCLTCGVRFQMRYAYRNLVARRW